MQNNKSFKSRFFNSQGGFSLVELAMVLAIIGLIIGGVLKGQDLLESARQKSVISQVNEFRMGATTFMDRFGDMPGNFSKASEYISADLKNGNASGEISGPGLSIESEAGQFFQHLAAANLISKPGSKGVPTSRLGGVFTVVYKPREDMNGHWIALGKELGSEGNGGLLTPQQAHALVSKAGSTTKALDGADKAGGSCLNGAGDFNMENHEKACVLYFQL